ncbi:hypothetical protein BH11ARM1_BH11ARM1_05330 [soil metagenome]
MARRAKLTPFEREVYNSWAAIAFAKAPLANPRASWDKVLGQAFQDGQWIVSPALAATISTSRWFDALSRNDYRAAAQELERCLSHVDPFDRHDRDALPTRLCVTQFYGLRDESALSRLEIHLDSGIYARKSMVKTARLAQEILLSGNESLGDDQLLNDLLSSKPK